MDGIEACPPGFGFRKLEESLSKPLPVMGGNDGDIVNEESFFVNVENDYPNYDSVAFGDGYSMVGDDLCVIVGHRARQYPDTLDVVPVRGVDERGHLRSVRRRRGPERKWDLCHRVHHVSVAALQVRIGDGCHALCGRHDPGLSYHRAVRSRSAATRTPSARC